MVAPTSVMVPSSMTGRKLSCCARLKRWISSTKSSVPLPCSRRDARHLEGLLEIGDAGEDRRHLLEDEAGGAGEQPRDRRLAGARRPPEDDRRHAPGRDHAGQDAFGTGEMVLPDDVGELLRPQAVGQRPRRILVEPRRLEEIGHQPPSCRRMTRPPRLTANCQKPSPLLMRFIERVDRVDHDAVHLQDDIALAEDAPRRPALDVGGNDAGRAGRKSQLIGDGRRQIGDDEAGEGRVALHQRLVSRAVVSGAAISFDARLAPLGAALIFDDRRGADLRRGDAIAQLLGVLDRLAVDGEDDVAALEAGRGQRAVGMKAGDEGAFRPGEAERIGDLGGDVLQSRRRSTAAGCARPLPPTARRSSPCWPEWRSRCRSSRRSARRSPC